jgi:hypothetical protein
MPQPFARRTGLQPYRSGPGRVGSSQISQRGRGVSDGDSGAAERKEVLPILRELYPSLDEGR